MKVLYDARWLPLDDRFDGVGRYAHELAYAMAGHGDLEMAWLVYDQSQLDKLPPGPAVFANNPSKPLAELFTLARTINKSGYTIVYSPFFTMGTFGKRYKLVLTIHDLIYFTHRTPPHWLPWYIRIGWWLYHTSYWPMRWQLNHANIIATVSETVRRELLAAHATKREVMTVSNAVGESFTGTTLGKQVAKNDIVYLGAFTPYKNVECVIDALQYLPGVTLHLVSKIPPARRKVLTERIHHLGVTNRVIIHDGVNETDLRKLLSQARCGVSASRAEGFGLPVLETQQAGTPYACADTPIFHEVGGDSVLYFDPNSPKDCAEAIKRFSDIKTRQEYISRGYDNVTRFTWDNSAASAVHICRDVLNSTKK